MLYEYAGRLIDLAAEARAAVSDPTPRGLFRLGAMESTAAVRLPGPLTRYLAAWPEVELKLVTGNPVALAAQVRSGELEAAFFAEPVAEEFEFGSGLRRGAGGGHGRRACAGRCRRPAART